MKNELQKHKTSDRIKWIAVFIAVVMLGVMVAAVMTKGFTDGNPYGWFDKKDEQNEPEAELPAIDGDGNELENGATYPLPRNLIFRASSASESSSSLMLSATILPENATDKTVDWSIVWVDSSVSWVSGKSVTDYVTVTPTSDGSLTARVVCLQAFGAKIKIVVTSRDNVKSTAECVVDYMERIETGHFGATDLTVPEYGSDFDLMSFGPDSTNLSMKLYPSWTETGKRTITFTNFTPIHTLRETFVTTYTLKISEKLKGQFTVAGIFGDDNVDVTTDFTPNRALFEKLFGSNVYASSEKMSKLVAALANSTEHYMLECKFVGKYSEKTFSIPLKINTSAMRVHVSSITMDDSGLVF